MLNGIREFFIKKDGVFMNKEKSLRILFVEDLPGDMELAVRELRKSGMEFTSLRVDTGKEFQKALNEFNPEIVISDYALPSFDGMQALKLSKAHDSTIPFIILTGSMNEETAVECMKAGADDYVIKEHLSRISFAVREVIERKKIRLKKEEAEQALMESEEQYRIVTESIHDAIIAIDQESRIIYFANNSVEKMFGYSPSELLGKEITVLMPDRFRDRHISAVKSYAETGVKHVNWKSTEFPGLHKSGKEIHLEISYGEYTKGSKHYFIGVLRDVTERKQAEDALKLFRTLIDQSNDAIEVIDPETLRYLDVNEKTCLDLGYSREELLSLTVADINPTFSQPQSERIRQELKEYGSVMFESLQRRKNRSTFPVEINLRYVNIDRGYVVAVARDITERKRAEETLRKKEEHHKAVIENIFKFIPEGVLVLTESLNLLKQNKTFDDIVQKYAPLLGYTEEGLAQKIIEQLSSKIVSGDSKEIHIGQKDQLETGISGRDELILQFNTARMFLAEEEEEEEANIVVSLLDITERKRAEEEISMLAHSLRSVNECVSITDMEDKILFVNESFLKTYGYTKEELIGNHISIVSSPSNPPELVREILPATLRGGWKGELWNKKKDGIELPIYLSTTIINDKYGKPLGLIGVASDITERKRAVEELVKFKLCIQQSFEAIFITDINGIINYINPAFELIYGYNSIEVTGKTPRILKSNILTEAIYKQFWDKLLSKEVVTGEIINKTKDGRLITVEGFNCSILDSEENIIGFVGIHRDITERKRAEEEIISQKNKFAQLFENSPIAIALLDDQDKVIVINESFSALFGYYIEEIKGKTLTDFIVPHELKEEAKRYSDQTREGSQISKESYRKKKDGTKVYAQVLGIPIIINEKVIGIYGMYVDLTQRKEAEEKMKLAKELAEQSDRLKSEFLAQMSHEIRTPINIILGNTDYLDQSFSENMDADARDCFDGIDLASKRIIRTIDLILNVAELQTIGYKPQFVKIDLNSEILRKLYQEHQLSAKQKGLELIYKCELKETKILADEYSVTQIFANLIDNAIKYTKKGKVEILLTKNKDGNIVTEVKDTGIGISKEFLPRMFEPFVQEEQGYTRAYDGNGLGLALTKRYCDINNAVIEVESEKNVGSIFRVIFK